MILFGNDARSRVPPARLQATRLTGAYSHALDCTPPWLFGSPGACRTSSTVLAAPRIQSRESLVIPASALFVRCSTPSLALRFHSVAHHRYGDADQVNRIELDVESPVAEGEAEHGALRHRNRTSSGG